uniref:Large polyvalent protein-associated domain 5 n=2 Tax=unclassified Caudoviricetes TaxID=2788787 RepID=A0A8S5SJU7_9CAUD|nr:MAG TPA: Large polyvalent protein-associated domain 5 [Siphoviridae sp. ct8WU9]DAF50951.1 MAG TPA: Large polyvalent protein-associated domain 5 [Siphoviridae sp. ctRPk8]DAK91173.1 MAG TPA: Large polyvalent protein-associated domain 5 [Caudoviricetes sp.]DAM54997.1 MAG TPA: Large polyvalent protein-associated domain 5 [Caudoviricetes sp.]
MKPRKHFKRPHIGYRKGDASPRQFSAAIVICM